jgi:glycosyltransferase involved in cell wall biosynthesis
VPPLSGGATERSWYGLAKLFAAAGHSVTLISRSWPGLPDNEVEAGVRHIRLPGFDHTSHLAVNLTLDFRWGIRVARALPKGDIVICNAISLPVWLHLTTPSAGTVAVMIGRVPRCQVSFYRGVARIYVPSMSIAEQIKARWASERTRTIGYPIDWALHARFAAQKGAPIIIGYAGRIHPEKGIGLLVEAARILAARSGLPDWKIRVVGPFSTAQGGGGEVWFEALRKQAADAAGDRLEWVGPEFNPERLASLYGGMDIFCYPSMAEKGETFGVSIAEAMASRCAVVVSALRCFSDLIEDGSTGLVFDHAAESAPAQLAQRIESLMSDPGRRLAMAVRGQERARRFDYRAVAANILDDLALLTGTTTQKQP